MCSFYRKMSGITSSGKLIVAIHLILSAISGSGFSFVAMLLKF